MRGQSDRTPVECRIADVGFRIYYRSFVPFLEKLSMDRKTLQSRTKKFHVDVIHLCEAFPRNAAGFETAKQLIRSAGSVGANYRSSLRGKKYRRILDALAKNTNLIPTEIEHSELYDPSLGFDLLLHSKQSKKYILHILNKIGGVQRDSNLEHITEFYYANRVVRLNLSRTIIREHIICELNMLFRRLKLEAEIKIGGLPTSIEVREILNSLQEGHISIDEALNRTNVF